MAGLTVYNKLFKQFDSCERIKAHGPLVELPCHQYASYVVVFSLVLYDDIEIIWQSLYQSTCFYKILRVFLHKVVRLLYHYLQCIG